MERFWKFILFFMVFASCDSTVVMDKKIKEEPIITRSNDPREATFDREGKPDYTFEASSLLTPIVSESDRFFYAEMVLKSDEYPVLGVPELHGFYPYSNSPETEYEKNVLCVNDETLGINIGYIRDNILALKFTYIPPLLPFGDLMLHTAVKCSNRVYDRYILITGLGGYFCGIILDASENIFGDGIWQYSPGGKKDPDKLIYKPGFKPVYCGGRNS